MGSKERLLLEPHLKRKRETRQDGGGGVQGWVGVRGTSFELNSQDPAHVCDQLRQGCCPSVMYSVCTKAGSNLDIEIGSVALCEEVSNCFIWETDQPTKSRPPSITKPPPSEGSGPGPGVGCSWENIDLLLFPFPCLWVSQAL